MNFQDQRGGVKSDWQLQQKHYRRILPRADKEKK